MLFTTPPLTVIDHPADAAHYTKGRAGFPPAFIVLHHTGGLDSLAWLSTTSSPAVSTHRLITKDGAIFKIVDDADTAYTAGYGVIGPIDPDASDPVGIARNLNYASLNIELENMGDGKDYYPAAQMNACAAQLVEWFGLYGWLPILYHKHVDVNKNDPRGFDRPDLDRRIMAQLAAVLAPPPALPGPILSRLADVAASLQHDAAELGAVLTALKP